MATTKPRLVTGYGSNKDALLKRLTRAEGQIRGISRMVASDTYCIDVLTQISAVQAALDKTALELLRSHAKHCLASPTITDVLVTQKSDELIKAIDRLISR